MLESGSKSTTSYTGPETRQSPIVIFDIDGTLTECHDADFALFFDTVSEVLKIHEISHDLSGYADVTDSGIVHHIIATHLGRSAELDELQVVENEFASRLERAVGATIHFKEMKGAKAFVEYLESIGVHVGIATGNWRKSAAIKLGAIGLQRLASKAGTSTDARARKDILRIASQKFPESGTRTKWYIGDGVWDVECAKAIGFNFIGIGQKLKSLGLPYWADNFHAAEELLEAILVNHHIGRSE